MLNVTGALYRIWSLQRAEDPNISAFEHWIKDNIGQGGVNPGSPEELDLRLLCRKPQQRATRYCRMKAFGNHFRVEDAATARLLTFDAGIASVFHVPTQTAQDISVNYVGVLKDILELDYGPIHTPVILLKCDWMKRVDNRGNNTYTRDEAGFLLVNFRHKLPRLADPFIFPSQATQVFFSDILNKPGWKVVLCKEARSKREVVDTSDAFITTTAEASGLRIPTEVPLPPPTAVSLVGAIELSAQENLLATAAY